MPHSTTKRKPKIGRICVDCHKQCHGLYMIPNELWAAVGYPFDVHACHTCCIKRLKKTQKRIEGIKNWLRYCRRAKVVYAAHITS